MASFVPNEKTKNDFNKGIKYENGDGVQAETINNLIESQLFVQGIASNRPVIQYTDTDTPDIFFDTKDGLPRFVFQNIKGKKGDQGATMRFVDGPLSISNMGNSLNLGIDHILNPQNISVGDIVFDPYFAEGGNGYLCMWEVTQVHTNTSVDLKALGYVLAPKGVDGKTPYIHNGDWYIDGNPNSLGRAEGFSPTIEVVKDGDEYEIYITDVTTQGKPDPIIVKEGKDGRGIKNIENTKPSTESSGINTITVTYTDETTNTFEVRNGAKGASVNKVKSTTVTNGTQVDVYLDTNISTPETSFIVNDGNDGISPVISVEKQNGATIITMTDINGSKTATINDGEDGVSVTGVTQTVESDADGGENKIAITLSSGKVHTFVIKNGNRGSKGDNGNIMRFTDSSLGTLSEIGTTLNIRRDNLLNSTDVAQGDVVLDTHYTQGEEYYICIWEVTQVSSTAQGVVISLRGMGYVTSSTAKIVVDNKLSTTSENPVQNKVINKAIGDLNTNLSLRIGTTEEDILDLLSGEVPANKAENDSIGRNIANTYATKGEINQIKPEFAQSVEECTDTSKVYVLPDGFLYAYMTTTTSGALYKNQLPISTDTDGSIFNGIGYKNNYRLNSSGNVVAYTGRVVTGFIPCKRGDIIRCKNLKWANLNDNIYICSYKANKSFIYAVNGANSHAVIDETNKLVTFNTRDISSNHITTETEYVRLCFYNDDANWDYTKGIITVNEEIIEGTVTTKAWTNTGHAFIPADYEDRIIAVENKSTNNTTAINNLKTRVEQLSKGENVVDYVKTEAERVAKLTNTYQNGSTLTFAAVSDTHYNYGGFSSGIEHLGQALDIIQNHTPLDFFAHFGDWLIGDRNSTIEDSIEYFEEQNAKFAVGVRDVLNIRMNGNHDALPYNKDGVFTATQLFSYIGKWNGKDVVTEYGNVERNYGYVDFERQKIRVIFLNTSDLKGDTIPAIGTPITNEHRISSAQLNWFANTALKMTNKSDATDWGIVLCSHAPITWNNNLWKMFTILQKHENGASGTIKNDDGVVVNYNFTSENKAKLIAYFHGHVHCFKVEDYVIGSTTIPRISIPNACNGRENEYPANTWGEDTTYPKTANTSKDTTFNIVTIDRENRKIYCTNYGAGYDREIDY